MEEATRNYRKSELEKVSVPNKYGWDIKIRKSDGETKWLRIEEHELKQIKAVLTGKVFVCAVPEQINK